MKRGIHCNSSVLFHATCSGAEHGNRRNYRSASCTLDKGNEHGRDHALFNIAVDYIVPNCSTQDTWVAVMIADAVVARSHRECPDAVDLWLVSDNARTYKYDVLLLVAPFIASAHGLALRSLLYPETARGKSLVDTHFPIVLRQLHRYLKETESEVTTPEGIVTGMAHTTAVSPTALSSLCISIATVQFCRCGGMQFRAGVLHSYTASPN